MEFQIGKSKYQIGSKLFPIAQKSKMQSFYIKNTQQIDNVQLSDFIDKYYQHKIGGCYSNADQIIQIGEKLNLNIQYYAGWLFLGNNPPLHHAWAVLDNNVIDCSFTIEQLNFYVNYEPTSDNWREQIAPDIKRFLTANIPAYKKYIFGNVPAGLAYVGSPDDLNYSRKIFRELRKKYPDHPSYKFRGANIHGATKLQEEIIKISE